MDFAVISQDNVKLRPYQVEAKRIIFESWNSNRSLLLQMPTGTGKTFLFSSIVNDILRYYKEKRIKLNVLIVVHRIELIDQISKTLDKYNIGHGIIQGNTEQHLWQRIQVASVQSLISERNTINVTRLDFEYIIIDEAHHAVADSYKRVLELFPKAKVLGVTATPWRLKNESFLPIFDKLITTPQISWFIKNHLLADFDYVSIKPDSEIQKLISRTKVSETGDYMIPELSEIFDNQSIRAKLYSSYKQFAFGRKGIIYAIDRCHAFNIASTYSANGVPAVMIDCFTPKEERAQLVDAFKRGNIQVLVNVEIFTEGFDCPDVSFIQLARPTRSLALFLQQVGRGLRSIPGKENTIILDNVGLYNVFGLPDTERDWQKSFVGGVEFELPPFSGNSSREITEENNYEESNEEMVVIKSTGDIDLKSKNPEIVASPTDINFILCDYFLVQGNPEHFKVFTVIKEKGIMTGRTGILMLEWDLGVVKLSGKPDNDIILLHHYPKLENILLFATSLCKTKIHDMLSILYDSHLESYDFLSVLEEISKLYRRRFFLFH